MSPPHGKIVVRNLYKLFGSHPRQAMQRLNEGWDKQRLNRESGVIVGVNDVSFEVAEGEIFVLMGLSGSGKSTLIRLVNRLIEPTAGQVLIDGRDVSSMNRRELIELRRREMSMVFQSFALMPTRNVLDNAAFGLEVAGVGRAARERRATEVLEQVGLQGFATKRVDELSGGMQQRVGLARALAVDPSLIIMDEAFSALDPLIRREMQEILLGLQREHRRTVLFVSHDIEEALRIGSRIAIMEGGRMVQVGTPEELVAAPADDYVRHFFSTVDTSRFLVADQLKADSVPVYVHNGRAPEGCQVRRDLEAQDKHYAFVVDEQRSFRGSISLEKLALLTADDRPLSLEQSLLKPVAPVAPNLPLSDVIERLISNEGPIPVVDDDGRYTGAITKGRLLSRLQGAQP
ncbi:quaternary amine ABC transporter ATP-binding protein [Halotalea alkalilenta]|uniref:quaternary amine ABC transporter ATP-binding protein n=1 Tax=Halotalea alkalilenta TaxID=376489 RepID=UPI00048541E3|nr:glycine betaine/L-proline ABC transporter ATP-binding protein [Halotalea alkalilenta]